MTTEVTMLAYTVTLFAALIAVQAVAGIRTFGLPALAGNRDNLPAPTGFAGRMQRVVGNHVEGLVVFAPLVLIASVSHISNAWTVLGAQLFFWARLAHAVFYMIGVPWLRTGVFFAGLTGAVMILLAVLGLI